MSIDVNALQTTVAANITKPQSVRTDAGDVTMHPLSAQIDAIRQISEDQARANGNVGPRFTQLKMGGTIR